MTRRDDILTAFKGGIPESVPCYYNACQIIVASPMREAPKPPDPGYDGYGVHQTPTDSGGGMYTPTPTVPPILSDITRWREVIRFPDYDDTSIDWGKAAATDRRVNGYDQEKYMLDAYSPNGMFERLHFLMGFEGALCALYEHPDHVYDLVGAIADNKIQFAKKIARYYKPDYFTMLDDYAYASGMFFSIDVFREVFKPHLKRIVNEVQAAGMIHKQHCCGKMENLLEDYLELGITAFDPVQPVNDIQKMKYIAGGTAGFMGGLDVQNVIDRQGVTEEEIRTEVRRCIDEYAPGGGYIVFGVSLGLYDPPSYEPTGRLGIVIDECEKYGKNYYR